MQRQDDNKASFADFVRSIKFRRNERSQAAAEVDTHFAHLESRVKRESATSEDQSLIRSAN